MNTRKNREEISAKRLSALAFVLCGGALLALSLQAFLSFAIPTQAQMQTQADAPEELRAPVTANPFENVALEARAVFVFDLKKRSVLFARNENEKLPLASVTKIMTALVAREHMSESVVATLTGDDISVEGDSGLRTGERWRLGDLISVMLLVSSNDAAHAVAGFVGSEGHPNADMENARSKFIGMMNEKALALGLTQTQFFNESGLDISGRQNDLIANSGAQAGLPAIALATAGGYGSAHDVALLFAELWNTYPETIEITARKDARIVSQDDIAHILPNTNEIVGTISGLVASKTGYTDLAGGNLAIIFDRGIGDPVVVVVLGSTYKGRFDDIEKLVEASRKVAGE